MYNNFLKKNNTNSEEKSISLENIASYSIESSPVVATTSAEEQAKNMRTNFMGETDDKVKNLQIFLKNNNYSLENTSGKMDLATLHALRKYQFDKNI